MQTLIAYAIAARAAAPVEDGCRRVERAYDGRWQESPVRHLHNAPHGGLILWEGGRFSRWPAWSATGARSVASLYAPVGYERVVQAEPLATAPTRLATELDRCPSGMDEILPPFVLGSLDEDGDRLRLTTDSLGIGRLFELRTRWGWVWSNRPEAALAFAGEPYRMDEVAWAHNAVADEVFGHSSPYQGVRLVDAGTTITWDGHAQRLAAVSRDPVTSWSIPGAPGELSASMDAAVDSLTTVAASIGHLFPGTPTVALTGGRDSRLVAAAFLAAGTDITLTTHDALPEDLAVARDLIATLADPPEHRVKHVASGDVAPPKAWAAIPNATAWHDYAEGLRPYSYLHYRAPRHLDIPRPPTIGGAGGEVAHGFFYLAGRDILENLPPAEMISRFTDGILRRYHRVAGPRPAAVALVRERIRTSLFDIAAHGYDDFTVLDLFYLRQRLRRWGTTGERPGTISPLIAPAFIRACIGLTPEQRQANLLHRELTRRLVPQWADAPYYPAEYAGTTTTRTPIAPRIIRVADATDRDAVNSLVHDPTTWESVLRPEVVRQLWADSLAGHTDAREERVLRAMIWRAAFSDRLHLLDGRAVRQRPHIPWTPQTELIPPPHTSVTGAPQAERSERSDTAPVGASPTDPDVRSRTGPLATAARRAARSRAWTRLRDTPIGDPVKAVARRARRHGLKI